MPPTPGTINILISGQYKSITDGLAWERVPRLAILTGVNGAGKSQLLEVIANTFGAWRAVNYNPRIPNMQQITARAHLDDSSYSQGDVLFTRSEWDPISGDHATRDQIIDAAKNMHSLLGAVDANARDSVLRDEYYAMLRKDQKTIASMELEDFFLLLTPTMLWSYQVKNHSNSLAFLFLARRIFERIAKDHRKSPKWIEENYGETPWSILNDIMSAAGLRYRVVEPKPVGKLSVFSSVDYPLRLIDDEVGSEVTFSDLSSGELTIMSMANWRYQAEQISRHPKLFLLDEPDAHLHPSLTRSFLDVLQKVFVGERGARVIMTTHSPSTVALAEADCLFEMKPSGNSRFEKPTKQKLISVLTKGFVAVQDSTRIVMLEGPKDPPYFSTTWDILTDQSTTRIDDVFPASPNLQFIHGKGRDTVQEIIPKIRSHDLVNFFGVTDEDNGNPRLHGVHVLHRYAAENYLLDPLCVWFILNNEGHPLKVSGVEIHRWSEHDIFRRDISDIQAIVDEIFRKVLPHVTIKKSSDLECEGVAFIDGRLLLYPKWFLKYRGKDIWESFRAGIGQQYVTLTKLLLAYNALRRVPCDVRDILSLIQQGIP